MVTLVLSSQAHPANYFVGQTPAASDRNQGTKEDLPLRTITAAAKRVQPGDTVFVLPGNYRSESSEWGLGVVPILISGTETKPIRFQARDNVFVDQFLLWKVSHVTVDGFQFRGVDFADTPGWLDMPAVVRNLPETSLVGINYSTDYSTRRTTIEKAFATYLQLMKSLEYRVGINIVECTNVKATRNSIDGYWAGIQCRSSINLEISRNRIFHTVNGIYCRQLVKSLILQNIVSQSLDIGIDVRETSADVMVEANQASFNGISHIAFFSGTTKSTIRRNSVSNAGYYSQTMQLPGSSGINLNHVGEGNLVEWNGISNQIDLTDIDGNGIILDLTLNGHKIIVRNNVCFRNMGSGINLTASPNATIYGNILQANGSGGKDRRNGAGIKLSRDQDVGNSISWNLFAFNRSAGILSYRTIKKQSLVDFNAYSSTWAPLIWDGFQQNENAFRRIIDIRSQLGWETSGTAGPVP
jgi:hypothetical protein